MNNQNNVLNNPEKLFPPDYIKFIIEKSSVLTYSTNYEYVVSRRDLRGIDTVCCRLRHSIVTVSDDVSRIVVIELLNVLLRVNDFYIDDWNNNSNYSNVTSDKLEKFRYTDDMIRSTIKFLNEQKVSDNNK